MRCTQLTQEERYQIYTLLKADHTQTDIDIPHKCLLLSIIY